MASQLKGGAASTARTEAAKGAAGRFWGVMAILLAVYLIDQSPMVALMTSISAIVVLTIIVRESTAVNICLLAALPYAIGSYMGLQNDITYYPRPSDADYELAGSLQCASVLLAAGIGAASGVSQLFQKQARIAIETALNNSESTKYTSITLNACVVLALIIGLRDSLFVLSNFSDVINSSRHSYGAQLWVGRGPEGIVLCLVLSITVLYATLRLGGRKRFIFVLMVFWLPTLVAGGRNYLSVAAVAAVALVLLAPTPKKIKVLISLVGMFGVWIFTIVPTLWSENDLVWLNEWIMPNSLFLSAYFGYLDPEAVGASSFIEQSAFLLPSWLRPNEVHPFSNVFESLGVTNVGVGGNPWADFYFSGAWLPFVFAIATLLFFCVGILGTRLTPVAPLIVIGVMAFWGRSSFWNVMFIVVYGIIMSTLVMPRSGVRRILTAGNVRRKFDG